MASAENIVILIPDTPTFEALSESVAEKVFVRVISHLEKNSRGGANAERWLLIAEAKKILPFESKKKWKSLRDNLEIEFSKPGRQFLYLESSLLAYLKNHSTIKNSNQKHKR